MGGTGTTIATPPLRSFPPRGHARASTSSAPLPRCAPVAQRNAGAPASTAETGSSDMMRAVFWLYSMNPEVREGATPEEAMRVKALHALHVCMW